MKTSHKSLVLLSQICNREGVGVVFATTPTPAALRPWRSGFRLVSVLAGSDSVTEVFTVALELALAVFSALWRLLRRRCAFEGPSSVHGRLGAGLGSVLGALATASPALRFRGPQQCSRAPWGWSRQCSRRFRDCRSGVAHPRFSTVFSVSQSPEEGLRTALWHKAEKSRKKNPNTKRKK